MAQDAHIEKELRQRAENVSDAEVHKVLEERAKIVKKFEEHGPLGRFVKDLGLLFSIIQDYVSGKYREVPWYTIAAIVVALLYVLSPIDMIPDFIPGVGYLDDAMVVAACLSMVQIDLRKYEEWKTTSR